MKSLLVLLCLFTVNLLTAQNPYVGKWVAHDINSFKNRDTITREQRSQFSSYIQLNADMTFVKVTNGVTTVGRYEFTANKFSFLESDETGKFTISWGIRWPKNTKDPFPETPEIDISYPELFTVAGKFVEMDVYYVKMN